MLLFGMLWYFKTDHSDAMTPMLIVTMLSVLCVVTPGDVAKHLCHAPAKVFATSLQSASRFNSRGGLAIAGRRHELDGLDSRCEAAFVLPSRHAVVVVDGLVIRSRGPSPRYAG